MTATSQSVDLDRRGRIAVLTVNNPPVNALSQHVRQGLRDGLKQAAADGGVDAIVIVCAGRTFIAGADITEFGKPPKEPGLHEVLDLIEGSPKPVVAVIHGTALGGGLEFAMACHYRVAVPSAKVGQPEVTLGIIPGAGGTQRLTRAIGKALAMEMVLNNRTLSAGEALQYGLVNRVVPAELLLDQSLALAAEIAARAPLAAAAGKQAVNQAYELSLSASLAEERNLFYGLFDSADQKEGMQAFIEKRRPNWKGK